MKLLLFFLLLILYLVILPIELVCDLIKSPVNTCKVLVKSFSDDFEIIYKLLKSKTKEGRNK